MDDLFLELKHRAKQCLAAVLFIILLIGASAAALALLAAGISTLSSPRTLPIAYPTGQYPTTAVEAGTTPPTSAPNTNDAADVDGNNSNSNSNNVERIHSPIGEALNNGGVVLGDHIQQAFGNIVAGILQTLFLEQDDNSSTQSQGLSTNHSNGGGGQ